MKRHEQDLIQQRRHNPSGASSSIMMLPSKGVEPNMSPKVREESIRKMLITQDSYRGFGDESTVGMFGDFTDDLEKRQGTKRHDYELQTGKEEWSKHGFAVTKTMLVHMLSPRTEENEDESGFSFTKPSRSQHGHRRASLCTITSSDTEGDDEFFDFGGDGSMGDFSLVVPNSKSKKLVNLFRSRPRRMDSFTTAVSHEATAPITAGPITATTGKSDDFRPRPRRMESFVTAVSDEATAPVTASPITTSTGDSADRDDVDDDDEGCFSYIKPTRSEHGRRRASLCTIGTSGESDQGDDFEFGGDESMGDFGKTATTILGPQAADGEVEDGNFDPFANSGFSISRLKLVQMMSLRRLKSGDSDDDELDITIQPSKKVRQPGQPQLEIVDADDHDSHDEGDRESSLSNDEIYDVALAKELKELPASELASRFIQMQQQAAAEQQQKLLEQLESSYGSGGAGGTTKRSKGEQASSSPPHRRRKKHGNQKKSSSLSSIELSSERERKKSPKSSKRAKSICSPSHSSNHNSKVCSEGKSRASPTPSRRQRSPGHHANKWSSRSPKGNSEDSVKEVDEEGLIKSLSLDFNALSASVRSHQRTRMRLSRTKSR